MDSGCITIDESGEILKEYRKRLKSKGQPGVGDFFYRHILNHRGNARRVHVVDPDDARGDKLRSAFQAGLSRFDLDDQVFALCAVVDRVPVATAIDSDWEIAHTGLVACGVRIKYVCGKALARAGGVEGS